MLNAGSNGLFEPVVFIVIVLFIAFVVFALVMFELATLVALVWAVFEFPEFVAFPDAISEVFTGVVVLTIVLLLKVELTADAGELLTDCVKLLVDGEVFEAGCVDELFVTG